MERALDHQPAEAEPLARGRLAVMQLSRAVEEQQVVLKGGQRQGGGGAEAEAGEAQQHQPAALTGHARLPRLRNCSSASSVRRLLRRRASVATTSPASTRSDEHTSELQAPMRIPYAVF